MLKKMDGFRSLLLRTLLGMFVVGNCAQANEHFSPFDQWQTLTSEHFRLSYQAENQVSAERTLQIAERSYETLAQVFGYEPRTKIELVISEQQDQPNGYASPIPYNRSVIFLAKPNRFMELSDYGNWIEDLLIHELSHIFHLDMAKEMPLTLQSVFGRHPLLFPNIFQPNFLKEGLATYLETDWEQGIGRGQSAYYDMILRTEVNSGTMPLGRLQQTNGSWPYNQSYVYGVAFYQFLDEQFGPEAYQKLYNQMSEQLVPLQLDAPIRAATNAESIEALWPLFEQWLNARFQPQVQALKQAKTEHAKPIKKAHSLVASAPFVGPNGDIYTVHADPYHPPSLQLKRPESDHFETLAWVSGHTQILDQIDNELWLIQENACGHMERSFDLYALDLSTHQIHRRSNCQHYLQADIRRNSDSGNIELLAIQQHAEIQSIVQVDLHTNTQKALVTGASQESFASARWLPGKDDFFYSYKDSGNPWAIMRYEHANNHPVPVLQHPKRSFFSVIVSPAGDALYFVSDAQNLVEIWRSDLSGEQRVQMTRSLGGSIRPALSPASDQLFFQEYTHKGWRLNIQANQAVPQTVIPAPGKPGHGTTTTNRPSTKKPYVQNDYSALDTVLPRSWFFDFSHDAAHTSASITSSGRDTLNFHSWSVRLGRDFENDLPIGQVSYTLFNHLNLSFEQYYEYQIGSIEAPSMFIDEAITEEKNRNGSLIAFHTEPADSGSVSVFAGINEHDEEFLDKITQSLFRDLKVRTYGAGLILDNSYRPIGSLGPVFGRNIRVTVEKDDLSGTANINDDIFSINSRGYVWSIDWKEFVHLFQAHRLELRAFVADANRGADIFDLSGSSFRSFFSDYLLHRRDYELRGYPDQSVELFTREPRIYSVDYDFPSVRVDRGFAGWPLGMKSISGTLFYETAKANPRFQRFSSVGAEINLGIDLAYGLLPVQLLGGIAFPMQEISTNPDKDANTYLKLGVSF